MYNKASSSEPGPKGPARLDGETADEYEEDSGSSGEEQVTLTEMTLDPATKAGNRVPGIGGCDSELLVPRRKFVW